MVENIRISSDKSHVFISVDGKPSLRELKKTISKLVEIRTSYEIDKLLVDSRSQSRHPPMSHIYDGAIFLADMLKGKFRIAILVTSIDKNHSFFEDVALNRGATLHFFQREEAACAWLFKYDDYKPQQLGY